jgi:hypothetical protein
LQTENIGQFGNAESAPPRWSKEEVFGKMRRTDTQQLETGANQGGGRFGKFIRVSRSTSKLARLVFLKPCKALSDLGTFSLRWILCPYDVCAVYPTRKISKT